MYNENLNYFKYYNNEKLETKEYSSQFTLCSEGSYLEESEEGSNFCKSCLENGKCEGGYIPVYPDKNVKFIN